MGTLRRQRFRRTLSATLETQWSVACIFPNDTRNRCDSAAPAADLHGLFGVWWGSLRNRYIFYFAYSYMESACFSQRTCSQMLIGALRHPFLRRKMRATFETQWTVARIS